MSEPTIIPTDLFSRALRGLRDNPGALESGSTITTQDFYGNAVTWVVTMFRDGDGREFLFLQWNDALGGNRLLLPPEVVFRLVGVRNNLVIRTKRRQGHRLVAQRKERGDKLGNPEALARARKSRKARGR